MSDYTCFSKAGLRIELERIEAQLRRANATASAPSKLITVANYAALAGVGAGNTGGELAYVLTLKTYYTFVPTSTLAIDPVGMTTSGTAAGGTSRWERSEYASPDWRIRNNWYVDSVGGNDQNDGTTAATAIRTLAELARRWGDGPVQQVGDPNLAVNLFIVNDIPDPDALVLRPIFAPDTALRIFGGVSAVIRVGTVTGYAAQVPGTNTPAVLTDAAFAGAWELGERLRITTPGPQFNSMCQIQNDLGAGACNVSVPAYANEATFTTVPTPIAPVVGNAYAVERLRRVPLGFTKMQVSEWPSGFIPVVNIVDCNLVPISGAPPGFYQNLNYVEGEGAVAGSLVFYQCTIDLSGALRGVIAVNSFFRVPQIELRTSAQINGGGAWVAPATPGVVMFTATDVQSTIDYNFQMWGLGFVAWSQGVCEGFAVFNAAASFFNPGGHAVRIGNGGAFTPPTKFRFRGITWGSGSAGVGIHVAGCSSLEMQATPPITGALGDWTTYDALQCRPFDDALGVYTAAPIPPSWAAFVVAVGAGGFGLNAHNVAHDSHLFVNAAP